MPDKITLESLNTLVQEQAKVISELQKGNDQSTKEIAALRQQLALTGTAVAAPEAPRVYTIPEDVVKGEDKKSYKFTRSRFRLPGHDGEVIAEEAMHDPALVEQVLAIPGQTILVPHAGKK